MRSLPMLLTDRPSAQVIIVGREGISYGAKPTAGNSWKAIFCNEIMPYSPVNNGREFILWGQSITAVLSRFYKFLAYTSISLTHLCSAGAYLKL